MLYIHTHTHIYIYIVRTHELSDWKVRSKILCFSLGGQDKVGQSHADWTSPDIGGPYSRQDGERCSVSAPVRLCELWIRHLMALKSLGNWGEFHGKSKPWGSKTHGTLLFSQDFRQNMTKDTAISKAWHAVLGDFTAFQTSSLGLPVFSSAKSPRLLQAIGIQR